MNRLSSPKLPHAAAPTSPERITRAILSGALQKANDAVRADEEKDWRYALDAYVASCELLTQVLGRLDQQTDDWERVYDIRTRYQQRIHDLRRGSQAMQSPRR